jgi:hypothetical protein
MGLLFDSGVISGGRVYGSSEATGGSPPASPAVAVIAIRGTFLPPNIVELQRNVGITAAGQIVIILS